MEKTRSTWRIGIIVVSILVMGQMMLTGCFRQAGECDVSQWVAPSPDVAWKPSEYPALPVTEKEAVDLPKDLLTPGKKWRLTDLVEVALRNNSETRSTWHAAKAAAADWGSKKGEAYPQVEAETTVSATSMITTEQYPEKDFRTVAPSLKLTWLLFDFGGRQAAIEEKRQALYAADFSHNAAIQDAVYSVLEAYFQYANAKAMAKAYEASFNEAAVNFQSAKQLHQNGVATIADVLQAQTALSQAQLSLEKMQGQVNTIRGVLATAMGIPANTPYDIEDMPGDPPLDHVSEEVEEFIAKAEADRPDLAAQKTRVEQAMAHIAATRSDLYPSLALSNSFGGSVNDMTSEWETGNSAALMFSIPLFKGYSRRYDLIKAREEAEVQKSRLHSLEQTIILQVWTSYFNLKTSEQRVKTSRTLMTSATKSYEVNLARYKEGVGGLLDLLAAQSALENARAERVLAQAYWYLSFSELALNAGMLGNFGPDDKHNILNMFPTSTIKEK